MKYSKPTIVNKNIIDIGRQPIAFRLHTAMDLFIREGTKLNLTGEITLASMSYDIMNVMGVTMIDPAENCGKDDGFELLETNLKEYTKDYSFMKGRNMDEGINNPNIIDPDIGNLKPQLIDIKDKFIDTNDPFYEQDEELPESAKLEKIKQINITKTPLIKVAHYLCAINMTNKKKTEENKYLNPHKGKTLRRSQ
tara:strand:+ start:144 stop:728 length:585 start_codon:yes stop_codon:yes gene_type:complete